MYFKSVINSSFKKICSSLLERAQQIKQVNTLIFSAFIKNTGLPAGSPVIFRSLDSIYFQGFFIFWGTAEGTGG